MDDELRAPAGGSLTDEKWRKAFAGLREAVMTGYSSPEAPVPGELYAYRVLCTGRYDWGRGVLVGPCGWEGASSRRAGDEQIPACPGCGGLTEPVAGTARLRRAK